MKMTRSGPRARGVTLVELIVSIVVIGVALAGVMVVIVRNTSASADPLIWHQAVIVGEAYLEEILTKNFTADGVEASRDLYDDVMDYNGLTDSPPRDQNGTAIAALAGYSVNVQVATEALNDITLASGNAVRAQVTVTMPTGGSVVVSGYRTNYN
jgi:MSHA pilin protein MshD